MRTSFLLSGLLLPWILLGPTTAHGLSPLCEQVLRTPPVSPYVKQVLDRSNEGITYAATLRGAATFEFLPATARTVGSFFLLLIDQQLTITSQMQDLTQNSACLHGDILQLQCQMDKVRDELTAAFNANAAGRINQLQYQLPFLRDRVQHLLKGSSDPTYKDTGWGEVSPIDPPDRQKWCCDSGDTCTQSKTCTTQGFATLDACVRGSQCKAPASEAPEASRLCPFSSDYGPAMSNGYGCDASVMGPRATYASMIAEKQSLDSLVNRLKQVNASLGGTTSLPATHQVVNGCKPVSGRCSLDQKVRCINDNECAAEDAGTCTFAIPADADWNAVRGPFSLVKDHLRLLATFLTLRQEQGFSRLQARDLQTANERFPAGSNADMPIFEQMFQGGYRTDFSNWSKQQGKAEVNAFVQSNDAELTTAAALPSSGVGGQLQELVTGKDGIRGFLIRYATYARRTCMNRPCSKKLDQILRLAYTDACFPYASGTFAKDTAENPQWMQCAKDACIPLPGVTLDTAKCVCYRQSQNANQTLNLTEVAPNQNPDVCMPR